MAFLNPWMLLALAGIASPIAIHLFNRFRPRTVEWAAMELLRRAMVTRSRQVRFEDLILLILRCAAIALVALAMAQLTLTGPGASMLGGGRPSVVIAIDASFSMEHRPGVASRFDQAMGRVRQILRQVDVGTPLSILLMGQQPQYLLRAAPYDDQTIEQVLAKAKPLSETLNLEANLDEIGSMLEQTGAGQREIYLVTDAQATTWGEISDAVAGQLAELRSNSSVMMAPLAGGGTDNLAITAFERVSGGAVRGGTARFVATVRNFGTAPAQQIRVRLALEGQAIDEQVIPEIGAGQAVDAPLFARFEGAGLSELQVMLDADPLATDNTRHAVALVRDRVRVLLVDGEPGGRAYEGETDYLATALQPRMEGAQAAYDVQQETWTAFNSADLASYDVVMLANVADLRPNQVEHLDQFVRGGGGLVVFLGGQVQPSLYNSRLVDATPLLPARLGAPVGEPASAETDGLPLRVAAADHPMVGMVAGLPQGLLDRARVYRQFPLQPTADAQVLLRTAGEGGGPLLVEKQLGRGRVLLMGTTADRAWTALPPHPVYPILLHQAMGYLTRQPWEQPVLVGEPLVLPLPETALADQVTFIPPQGEPRTVEVVQREGRRFAELPRTDVPGVWSVASEDGTAPMAVAVNVAPTESDVAPLEDDQRQSLSADLGLTIVDTDGDLAGAVRQARVGLELWWPLLLAALICFVIESLLARRFSGRMKTGFHVRRKTERENIREPEPDLAEAA